MNRYLPLLVALALAGCGGGGGGSSTPATSAASATRNSAVGQGGANGGPIDGTALKTQGNPAGGPFPLTAVTGTLNTSTAANGGGLTPVDTGVTGTVAVTFDPTTNNITSITYNQNSADHELLGLNGTTISNPRSVSKITKEMISNAVQNITFNKPAVINEALTFSSFGVWANAFQGGPHDGVFAVGVFAHGSQTPASAVPKSGSATYTGDAAGFASIPKPANDTHTNNTLNMAFDANAAIGINFGTGGVTSSITNIHAVSMDGIATTATLSNLNGTGNMLAGTAGYSTNLSSSTGQTGTLNGMLTGPTAQETVGTFSASGNGVNMIGAYGAKR
jgi:hypothetical protein